MDICRNNSIQPQIVSNEKWTHSFLCFFPLSFLKIKILYLIEMSLMFEDKRYWVFFASIKKESHSGICIFRKQGAWSSNPMYTYQSAWVIFTIIKLSWNVDMMTERRVTWLCHYDIPLHPWLASLCVLFIPSSNYIHHWTPALAWGAINQIIISIIMWIHSL